MKLFSRYNRYHLGLMAVLFLCSGVLYFVLVRAVLVHELDEALDDYKERIVAYSDTHRQFPVSNGIDDTYIRYIPVGTAIEKRHSLIYLPEPGKQKTHAYRQLVFTYSLNGTLYQVTIARPLEGTKLLTKTILAVTLGLLLLVILLSVLLNRLILANLWKPFYQAIHVLSRFQIGKGAPLPLPPTDVDEFRLLNEHLQQMVALAEQEYRILKEFTENAAHEMQTPLAIVRSKLDLVIQQEGLSGEQAEAIRSAYAGIKRLDKLNRALLLLARIENRQFNELSTIDLKAKATEKLQQLQEIIQASSLTAHSDLQECHITFNEALLDILLNNLLSNAIRHNVPGGSIHLTLRPGQLVIANTGPGQPLDTDRLFRRFSKEQQHTSLHGLGLSIVKQICAQSKVTLQYAYQDQQHIFSLSWTPE